MPKLQTQAPRLEFKMSTMSGQTSKVPTPTNNTRDWPALPGSSAHPPTPVSVQDKSQNPPSNHTAKIMKDICTSHFNMMLKSMLTLAQTLQNVMKQGNEKFAHLRSIENNFTFLPSTNCKTAPKKPHL